MTNQVKVILSPNGHQFQQSEKNPDKCWITVESGEGVSIRNGFLQKAITARITLDNSLKEVAAKAFPIGKMLPGKIVVKETKTPQWEGHTVCINPTTNAPALRNGSPYYRSAKYTENINEMDELIPSDASVVAAPAIQLGFPQRQF